MTAIHHHDEGAVRLLVLVDAKQLAEDAETSPDSGGGAGRWSAFVSELARVVDLEPVYLPVAADGRRWLDDVLGTAATWPGPVLVLPRTAIGAIGSAMVPHLGRALIASDDSPPVARRAGLAALHLLRSGVQSRVVLVLTPQTTPPMWEGTGHHATAWRAELARRHGRSTRVDVVSGDPGAAVRAHSAAADLVVLLWRGATAEGHGAVVRAVLDEGVGQPCLLLPPDWMETAPVAAGLREGVAP
jgi:hypothetical protein